MLYPITSKRQNLSSIKFNAITITYKKDQK